MCCPVQVFLHSDAPPGSGLESSFGGFNTGRTRLSGGIIDTQIRNYVDRNEGVVQAMPALAKSSWLTTAEL